ncbi:MAG: AAA family ATPase [Nostoc sp. NMS7]|uniref:AAA family ATPase n=1 Tax=Nostoc sp. NMS7 TaxID=2815391 RepID=UPI0025EB5EC0|nr:AAA family ATPase [Nostoc sp. NMS7]MBN3945020.1 AAA family ATPase [Nostoc sp. NMS7]
MLIKSVNIEGFWGKFKASANIFSDVTIFIGLNGTGKTTFINLIVAALSADFQQLDSLQFSLIKIILIEPKSKNSRRTISVLRKQHEHIPFINVYVYKIGSKKYQVYTDSRDSRARRVGSDRFIDVNHPKTSSTTRQEYIDLKQELSSLVEISQISVYRQSASEASEVDPRQRSTAVDDRLQQLLQKFARYQLKLEAQLNERSNSFQKEAISSLLYNEEFDNFDIKKLDEISNINLKTEEDKLSRAFKELGIEGTDKQIINHINKLKNAIEGLRESLKNGTQNIAPADVFAIPLINRTNKIIDLLNKSEEDKRRITEPRQKFFDILHGFMVAKKFSYDNKTSELCFSLEKNSAVQLGWNYLSSGEKQLLIQFMEVILQESRSLIFIADEPELSLHISWQEKILKTLRELNNNAQLIVATHSPDIVAEFRDNVIDMEDVIV